MGRAANIEMQLSLEQAILERIQEGMPCDRADVGTNLMIFAGVVP